MSKRLLITSTDLMMVQFLIPHVIYLSENGFEVEIACSDVGGRMDEIREKLKGVVKEIHIVRLVRSPVSPTNFKGYGDMKKVINRGNYDVIWTNEPVMGVVTRLAARKARKKGTKVIYMVHGFHFYEGAPKKDWIIFYPVEKEMSRLCDEIVTINREDYERAKNKMHAKFVKYVHGIGFDISRGKSCDVEVNIREELKLDENAFLVLSVGELHSSKNQQVIIEALGVLKDSQIHYILCGRGELLEKLKALSCSLGIEKNVHFMGYRKDVMKIYEQVDLFAFPSKREGLGLAGLEAMSFGLPMVTSNNRGPVEYMIDGKTGYMFDSDDVEGFARGIKKIKEDKIFREKCSKYNRDVISKFAVEHSKEEIYEVLKELV